MSYVDFIEDVIPFSKEINIAHFPEEKAEFSPCPLTAMFCKVFATVARLRGRGRMGTCMRRADPSTIRLTASFLSPQVSGVFKFLHPLLWKQVILFQFSSLIWNQTLLFLAEQRSTHVAESTSRRKHICVLSVTFVISRSPSHLPTASAIKFSLQHIQCSTHEEIGWRTSLHPLTYRKYRYSAVTQ